MQEKAQHHRGQLESVKNSVSTAKSKLGARDRCAAINPKNLNNMEKKVIAELPVKVYGEDFKIGIRMWRTISYTIRFELVDIYPNLEPMLRGWFITEHISQAFDALERVCGKRLAQEQKILAIDAYQEWESL